MMKRPFLDDWITRCCGLEVLNEESLRRYQLNKINEVLRYTGVTACCTGNVLLAFLNVTVRRSGRECGPRRPTM